MALGFCAYRAANLTAAFNGVKYNAINAKMEIENADLQTCGD